jgi:hypothetical protein
VDVKNGGITKQFGKDEFSFDLFKDWGIFDKKEDGCRLLSGELEDDCVSTGRYDLL